MFPHYYSLDQNQPFSKDEAGNLKCNYETIEVVNQIPRFVKTGSYATLFGDQWKVFKKTQLDSISGVPITRTRLQRCLGNLFDSIEGKTILEAGCGAGRFTEILLEKGAYVVSSDISTAVEVNKENFPIDSQHLIIQADINKMPFSNGSFDIVLCLGVIQHTPSPEETITNLYRLVRPGGFLVIDHYTFNKSFWFRLAPLYRRVYKKLPAEKTLLLTRKLVERYLPLHKKYSKNRIISLLLNRISPVISYYNAFPLLNDHQQKEWSLLDTHDSLTDYYKHFRSKGQIIRILKKLGAVNIECEYSEAAVEARCQKP